jgi:hypothetical protein
MWIAEPSAMRSIHAAILLSGLVVCSVAWGRRNPVKVTATGGANDGSSVVKLTMQLPPGADPRLPFEVLAKLHQSAQRVLVKKLAPRLKEAKPWQFAQASVTREGIRLTATARRLPSHFPPAPSYAMTDALKNVMTQLRHDFPRLWRASQGKRRPVPAYDFPAVPLFSDTTIDTER